MSQNDIAVQVSLSQGFVSVALRKMKISRSSFEGVRQKWDPLKAKALELYNTGMNLKQAALEVGVDPSTVGRWATAAGVNRGPPPQPKREGPKKKRSYRPIRRSHSLSGELIINFERPSEKLKELIRDRFRGITGERECLLCGMSEKKNRAKLSIHAVTHQGKPQYMVPICKGCKQMISSNPPGTYDELLKEYVEFNYDGIYYLDPKQ